MNRYQKLGGIIFRPHFWGALTRGTAAALEHEGLLRSILLRTVIDVGANRGQFALVALATQPDAEVYSFEPLTGPAAAYRKALGSSKRAHLVQAAVGPAEAVVPMFVTRDDDSSSLLRPTDHQNELNPGSVVERGETVRVAPLDNLLPPDAIIGPALLKIDVQGYEIGVLEGSEPLDRFDWIYVECSFVGLYESQPLADEVIRFLSARHFRLEAVSGVSTDRRGAPVQGDFLFRRLSAVPGRGSPR